ncbi:diguanylate cyclase [Allgaiera indica]|uniref:Diguanylate cyclase n=1 Tax=Allgaiera indica TaxID=765699 RepID=A0AAN4URT3_9RHOB|nr:bifunctional diguanylate cyclase/phosphodiesterase [Allgaiera indica]GHE02095.1 diguanylate cyclase [Allgaiera indica]SDX04775.1 diguanylate cyclase/phosphodiesterase [Allgaiera indica]
MRGKLAPRAAIFFYRLGQGLRRPENLAFLPAVTLAAFWLGGEASLILAALGLPILYLMSGAFKVDARPPEGAAQDGTTGLILREGLVGALDAILAGLGQSGKSTACLVIHLDDARTLTDRHGHAARGEVLRRTVERMHDVLRGGDIVARLEGDSFAVVLQPVARIDLESVLQLATRLQQALTVPIAIDALRVHVSASVGFCLAARAPDKGGRDLLDAAEIAAKQALANGPGAVRAWSDSMQRAHSDRRSLRDQLETALGNGQVRPYFQPQISTETGALSGFEALARWDHPERGMIPTAEFLPLVAEAGLSERLGEVMLFGALTALSEWDAKGLDVPSVAVNFTQEDLANPHLPERLQWELDRFGLGASRLTVEVLETVVAGTENDVVVRNLAAVSKMGCGIDLDDFGTGHASLAAVRRFGVRRIKIDRSFVTRLEEEAEQRKMVAAILSMAEQLGLETLAEGVESAAEHALLAQLGCGHVQGFGIGKPMRFEITDTWIARHRARQTAAMARIGKRAG